MTLPSTPTTPPTPRWIELDGAVNVRDVGGLPIGSGDNVVAARRLIRSDNLQGLSERDVRGLIDDHGVRSVVDLRTTIEVVSEGPGPLTTETDVVIVHASLFIESDETIAAIMAVDADTNAAGADTDSTVATTQTDAGPVVLPWSNRPRGDRHSAAHVYLSYITDRPDSIVAALRLIAHTDGATIVHCAAGKDRTGVVIALALDAVGVPRDVIVDDYARTAERLTPLLARLASSPTYAADISLDDPQRHAPRPDTMRDFFQLLDTDFDGPASWLVAQGWTADDQRALEAKLVD
jgi:protein-tyrosine phosphatase